MSGSSSDSSSDTATSDPVGGNVSQLTVSDGNASIEFGTLADDDDIVIMIHSFSDTSSSAAFQVGASENSMYLTEDYFQKEIASKPIDPTEEFHLMLRELESKLDPSAVIEPASLARYAVKYSVGSERTFKVLNSFSSSSSYDNVTATLRYETDDFQFYVDNRNAGDLDEEDLAELADSFLSVIDQERGMLGTESDVNGDGKFAVLFTQTVNGLAGSSGGIVTGFFYAIDVLSPAVYSLSNGMEVFYTFVPDPNGDYGSSVTKSFAMTNIYPGVLVHEFQHMINFNLHYFVNEGSAETGWLNEGLSHLMEDIYSIDDHGYMTHTGLENPARVEAYLESMSDVCLTCGTSLTQRGGSYLFMRYLYEQAELGRFSNLADGADLLEALVNTNLRSVSNINDVLFGDSNADSEFQNIFGLFGLAAYLSNTEMSDDNRLGFLGINLRSMQDDNRGTVLNGPSVQNPSNLPFLDTLTGNGISFIQLSGSTINSNSGKLDLSFSNDAEFGGYVIY